MTIIKDQNRMEGNNDQPRNGGYSKIKKWSEKYSHLPWFIRYEFLAPAFLGLILFIVFVLPPRGAPSNAATWGLIILCFVLYLALVFIILSDPEKPLWFKNISALGIFIIFGLMFYRYSNARWERLGKVFFNFEIMSKGDFLASGSSYSNWDLMGFGLLKTLEVFALSAILGSLLGLFVAVMRSMVKDVVLNFFIIVYVDFFRAMPMIVMLLLVYAALPYTDILLSPEASGVLTLTLIEGAYMSEIFRSGIEAIHHGQTEAAKALGFSTWQVMRLIILPQALRIVIPPYTGALVGLMKGTALTSAISIFEILKTANQILSWYANATPLIIAAMIYIVTLLPMTRLSNLLERKWDEQRAR